MDYSTDITMQEEKILNKNDAVTLIENFIENNGRLDGVKLIQLDEIKGFLEKHVEFDNSQDD